MKDIKKSYLSLIFFFLWSWVLLFIPFFIRWFDILSHKYEYNEEELVLEKGIIQRRKTIIELAKIQRLDSQRNLIGNGSITIKADNNFVTLKYVKNVSAIMDILNKAVKEEREKKGVKYQDTF
ncbi:MAG: PH domain-containing protein [Acholeplasma sp.]|nr:PH domain-containing protein [Acholeplasma sp.]